MYTVSLVTETYVRSTLVCYLTSIVHEFINKKLNDTLCACVCVVLMPQVTHGKSFSSIMFILLKQTRETNGYSRFQNTHFIYFIFRTKPTTNDGSTKKNLTEEKYDPKTS